MKKFLVIEKKSKIYIADKNNIIDNETFILLTGKDINLTKRIDKQIVLLRKLGHTYIFDEHPIEGEVYIIDNKIFKCTYVEENSGLFSTLDNKMIAKYVKGPVQLK